MIYVGEVVAVGVGLVAGYSLARVRNWQDAAGLYQEAEQFYRNVAPTLSARVEALRSVCKARAFDDTSAQQCWRFRQASVLLGEAADHIKRAEGEG